MGYSWRTDCRTTSKGDDVNISRSNPKLNRILHIRKIYVDNILHCLQRLIPVDRGTDLYLYKAPDIPSAQTYTIRPYCAATDERAVYKVCTMTFKDGMSAADEFVRYPELPGDVCVKDYYALIMIIYGHLCNAQIFKNKIVFVVPYSTIGGYINLSPEVCFVVEDSSEIVLGAAVAAINAKDFRRRLQVGWVENLRQKYPAPREDDPDLVKDVIASLHNDVSEIPPDVLINHPAELKFMMVSPLVDPSVPKRLVTCILAALRANGKFLKWISF